MTHRSTNEGFVQWLVQDGYLSNEEYALYKGVVHTRNLSIHSERKSITSGEAIAYRNLCDKVVALLQNAINEWEQGQHRIKRLKP